ncbi:hypothetical protein [Paraburkholderia humisilvae]|nr:hypothetical protein [Paraburkholderia humisilvae]
MPRNQASDLILRTRLFLERIRSGHIERGLVNHLAQVCIISGFVARAGHGRLGAETFDAVEQQLARLLLDFDETGRWGDVSDLLLDGLTQMVNEYDRMLGTIRLEILAKASDHLDRLVAISANAEPHCAESRTVPAPTRAGTTGVSA